MAKNRIVLDAGALSAYAGQEESIRVALRKAFIFGTEVVVPAPVISETTPGDGRRDANVNRVLTTMKVVPLGETPARAAGALRYRHRRRQAGTIDAMVVACAAEQPGSIILTGEAGDLARLAAENGRSQVVSLS